MIKILSFLAKHDKRLKIKTNHMYQILLANKTFSACFFTTAMAKGGRS